MKVCRKCEQSKTEDGFSRSKANKDGLNGICKICDAERASAYRSDKLDRLAKEKKEYRRNNPGKEKAAKKRYYDKNTEKVKTQIAKWKLNNQNRIKEYSRKQWRENKDHMMQNNRKWVLENKDRMKWVQALWRDSNRSRRKELEHNRRAKLRSSGGRLSKGIVEKLLVLQKGLCACCGASLAEGYHLDHIVSIIKGGENCDANVQLLTPFCNLSKGDKDYQDYLNDRRNHARKEENTNEAG